MKKIYTFFVAWVVFLSPLSIKASEAYYPIRIGDNEKQPIWACAGVDVIDILQPVFSSCPTNIVKTPTSENSCWTVDWTALAATDNHDTPTITQAAGPTNGSCLAIGTYSVIYKAIDAHDNVATCAFSITINSYLKVANEKGVVYEKLPTEGSNMHNEPVNFVDNTNKTSEVTTITSKAPSDIRLFPNPANDVLSVDLTKYNGLDVTISLYNLFGQQVLTQQLEKVGSGAVNLDVSKNQAGNYWVRVVAKGRKDAVKQLYISK
jgi:HYR domain/Secretion system C-terminal sorting domain